MIIVFLNVTFLFGITISVGVAVALQKFFDGKPYFWTGSYFVASCGSVTVEQLKKYVENQNNPIL